LNSQYSSTWAAENFYRTELLTGVGQAFAFIGLVGCIVLQAIFAGALAKPEWVLTFSAFFHTIRIFGGTAGAIYMGHFLAQREKLHSNLLGLHVSSGDWITDQNVHAVTAGLYAKSSGMAAAGARAIDLIAARLRLQAYSLSILEGVPSYCVELRMRIDLCRSAAPIAIGLWRPEHATADTSLREGVQVMKRNAALFLLMALLVAIAFMPCLAEAQETGNTAPPRHMTLHEAVQLALNHNHNIRIASYTVEEKQHAKEGREEFVFSIDTE